MARSRLGAGLNSGALLLAAVAIATIGPFAQSVVLAVVVGLPLAVAGLILRARRTGILAMLSIGSAVAVNPLIVEIPRVEYVAIGVVVALVTVAVTMATNYARARKLAPQSLTL